MSKKTIHQLTERETKYLKYLDKVKLFDDIEFQDKINKFLSETAEGVNNPRVLTEGVAHNAVVKTRNDVMKFIKKHVDSSDITPMSNFESYTDSDRMGLKLGVFNKDSKKLVDLHSQLASILLS